MTNKLDKWETLAIRICKSNHGEHKERALLHRVYEKRCAFPRDKGRDNNCYFLSMFLYSILKKASVEVSIESFIAKISQTLYNSERFNKRFDFQDEVLSFFILKIWELKGDSLEKLEYKAPSRYENFWENAMNE